MSSKLGWSAFNELQNPIDVADLANNLSKLGDNILTGRVLNVILDENSKNFEEYGGWNAIGTVEFEIMNYQIQEKLSTTIAAPIFSNQVHYPLVNELITLLRLPDGGIGEVTTSEKFYYFPPISVWNHPHHNAYPNPVRLDEERRGDGIEDYEIIDSGNARRVTDKSTEINLNGESGGTFAEKLDIHPLLPFAGDILVEGRFGNSIRLGNTSKTDSIYSNSWSDSGENGDPITIIRNGQSEDLDDKGWLPTTEDINKDLSSIILTSTQKIPIELNNESYDAFNDAPTKAKEYTKNQVILNSGRLVLQANSDSIIVDALEKISLTSNKTIGLSSNESINLSTPNVKLGSKKATESLILGDSFMQQFESVLEVLNRLASSLSSKQIYPGGIASPDFVVSGPARNAKSVTDEVLKLIKNKKLVSKVSKTV